MLSIGLKQLLNSNALFMSEQAVFYEDRIKDSNFYDVYQIIEMADEKKEWIV